MNAREERGLVIAALCKLNKTPQGWLVPSQSGQQIYTVDPVAQTCTCPDHQDRKEKCKHLWAVEFTMKREVAADGTVTETKTLTFTEKKVYRQVWPAYNAAQSVEKDRFQVLLFDLLRGVKEPERTARTPAPHLPGLPFQHDLQGLQHDLQSPLLFRPAGSAPARAPVQAGSRHEGLRRV